MSLNGIPVQNLPFLYDNNLLDSYISTTSLGLSGGQCRDDTNTVDMILNNALTISGSSVGVNGLDTGTLANTTWYYMFLISDPVTANPTAALLSASRTAPLLPFGYSAKRYIGSWLTDGSAHFIKMIKYGNSGYRRCWWDVAPNVLSAGVASSFTTLSLIAGVPPTLQTLVTFNASVTPTAAGNSASLRPTGSTSGGRYATISGSVAAVIQVSQIICPCLLATVSSVLVPAVDYLVVGSLGLSVAAFDDYV